MQVTVTQNTWKLPPLPESNNTARVFLEDELETTSSPVYALKNWGHSMYFIMPLFFNLTEEKFSMDSPSPIPTLPERIYSVRLQYVSILLITTLCCSTHACWCKFKPWVLGKVISVWLYCYEPTWSKLAVNTPYSAGSGAKRYAPLSEGTDSLHL